MANNRLIAIVTVLLLVGGAGATGEEPSIEDLLTIEKLIDDRLWQELYLFIVANPQLTAGNSPLALELQSYVEDAKRGRLAGFDAPPADSDTVAASRSANTPDVSIY